MEAEIRKEKSEIYLPDISVCIKDQPSTAARRFILQTKVSGKYVLLLFYLISASISTHFLLDQFSF